MRSTNLLTYLLTYLITYLVLVTGRSCDMELIINQSERSGHQQRLLQAFTADVFIFSLLVYIAH